MLSLHIPLVYFLFDFVMVQSELCKGNLFMKIANTTGTNDNKAIVKNIRLYESGEGNEPAKSFMNT